MPARIILCAIAAAILCTSVSSSATIQETLFERIRIDHEQIEKNARPRGLETASFDISSVEPQSIDVRHYKLQIQLTPNELGTSGVISGAVTINGVALDAVSSISVDAQSNLTIDSVTLDGNLNEFRRSNSRIIVN